MGYYGRGDYYRGDYYRGDPGLFSFVGKLARGLLSRTPAGMAISAATSAFKGKQRIEVMQPPPGPGLMSEMSLMSAPGPGGPLMLPGHHRSLMHPLGGAPGGGSVSGAMRGFHANKSTYVTRGGGTSSWPSSLQLHPAGTVEVRNRRMNPGNARALRHALRRVIGFAHLAKRAKRAVSRAASAIGVHHQRRLPKAFARKR